MNRQTSASLSWLGMASFIVLAWMTLAGLVWATGFGEYLAHVILVPMWNGLKIVFHIS